MFAVLASFCLAKKPVVLIPGLGASSLNGSTSGGPWYCLHQKNETVWINDAMLIWPFYRCTFGAMQLQWNENDQRAEQVPWVDLKPYPIGDVDGVSFVDHLFHDIHIVPTYKILAEWFVAAGWEKSKDLFGLPYDWRFGLLQGDTFWQGVIEFIEKIVGQTGEKAVLVGHSMGGFFVQRFLTEFTTSEWRAKYIDCGIMIAPSFGGSAMAFGSVYTGELPKPLSLLGDFRDVLGNLGGLHIHMPNKGVYGDTVIFKDAKGRVATPNNLTKLLKEDGVFPKGGEKIFEQYERFWQETPKAPDVPVVLVFDSAIDTPMGIEVDEDGAYSYLPGRGDGVVNSEPIEWACNNWKSGKAVDCYDTKGSMVTSNHLTILYNPLVLNYVVNHAKNSSWQNQLEQDVAFYITDSN